MFGEEFGFDYFQQRHTELVQAAERARLVHCLEEAQRASRMRTPLGKRVLGATGDRLVSLGSKLQEVAAH
jgi:hypothetical protein